MKELKIYTLEEAGQIVYIGKTIQALSYRLSKHRGGNFKGREISIELLESLEDLPANGWQEYAWISQFLAWGFPLENKQMSGEYNGIYGVRQSKEARAKVKKAWNYTSKGQASRERESAKKRDLASKKYGWGVVTWKQKITISRRAQSKKLEARDRIIKLTWRPMLRNPSTGHRTIHPGAEWLSTQELADIFGIRKNRITKITAQA